MNRVQSSKMSPSGSDAVPTFSNDSGIDSLPNEILVKVFSYLGHHDVLSSRLVDRRWCNVISSWAVFKDSVVYSVHGKNKHEDEAIKTLSKSDSSWSHVSFDECDLSMKRVEEFRVLEKVAHSVVSVEVINCKWTWKSFKSIITIFSNLKSLSLVHLPRELRFEVEYEDQNALSQDEMLVQQNWVALMPKLQSLTVECKNICDLTRIMIPNFNGLSNLISLELHRREEEPDEREDEAHPSHQVLLDVLYQTISRCEKTLKTLVLDLPVKYTEQVLLQLGAMVSNGDTCLDLTRFDLGPFQLCSEPLQSRLLEMLKSFLVTQNNLVDITLPALSLGPVEDQTAIKDLVLHLPGYLRSLHIFDENYLFPEVLDIFPDLRHLEAFTQHLPSEMSGKKYNNMRHLTIFTGREKPSGGLGWPPVFPYLTELNIRTGCEDMALQAIIKNLKMLRSLEIVDHESGSKRLTDFGVTGIQNEYLKHLIDTDHTFDDCWQEAPPQYVIGEPLCSLKGLNKLVIDSDHKITDVGIFFGFGFNELRFLEFALYEDITDWGFHSLGRLNPKLEKINLLGEDFGGTTDDGLKEFCKGFPRTKVTLSGTPLSLTARMNPLPCTIQ